MLTTGFKEFTLPLPPSLKGGTGGVGSRVLRTGIAKHGNGALWELGESLVQRVCEVIDLLFGSDFSYGDQEAVF